MSPNIDNGPAEVPLVEQLLSVPRTCHEMIEVGECAHRNIPYGEFCHMAAEEINNLVRIHAFNAGAFQAREAEIASLRLALAASRDEAEKAKAQLSSKRAEVRFQKNLVATADSVIHDMIPDSLDAGAAESAAHTIIDLRAKLAALAKECESLRADKERMAVLRDHLAVLTTTIFDYDRCQKGIAQIPGLSQLPRFKDCIPVPKDILEAAHKALDFDAARADAARKEEGGA